MAAKGDKMGGFGTAPVVLFVVLVAVGASISAVAWQDAPKGTPRYTIVDTPGVLQALLSSTVEETSYTDKSGTTYVYTGWTVEELMVKDLELRFNSTTAANVTSLSKGIEASIGKNLAGLAGEHHYNLEASFATAYLKIYDLDITGSAKATALIHMHVLDANAKVTLSMTE